MPVNTSVKGLFLYAALFVSAGIFESLYLPQDPMSYLGDPRMQLLWAGIYFVALIFAISDSRKVLRFCSRSKLVLIVPLLALLSASWAGSPQIVIRKSIAICCTYLIGLIIATTYPIREQLKLLLAVMLPAALLSYAFQLFFPGLIPTYELSVAHDLGLAHAGDWHGVFVHKNVLAEYMVLTICALACTETPKGPKTVAKYLLLLVCIGLLALSRSATGIVVFVGLLGCAPLLKQLNKGAERIALLLTMWLGGAIGALSFVSSRSADILALLGKTSTGTGRTWIWAASLLSIAKHPLAGYGFAGFWGVSAESLTAISQLPNHSRPAHAHNGYLEVLLELGSLGLAAVMVPIFRLLAQSLREYRSNQGATALWGAVLALYLLLYNLTEVTMIQPNSFIWVAFTAAAFRYSADRTDAGNRPTSHVSPVRPAHKPELTTWSEALQLAHRP